MECRLRDQFVQFHNAFCKDEDAIEAQDITYLPNPQTRREEQQARPVDHPEGPDLLESAQTHMFGGR
ncbi:MAG: hypothetical protein ABF792_08865 [Bifidobacterium psychraerophilum]|uniref:hypothetical protein n=1 Tax=Bifidobacterium psychraerophilum TaxID=218140 RepID=UPI0039EC0835